MADKSKDERDDEGVIGPSRDDVVALIGNDGIKRVEEQHRLQKEGTGEVSMASPVFLGPIVKFIARKVLSSKAMRALLSLTGINKNNEPDPAVPDVVDATRWLKITIFNKTDYDMSQVGDYFDSGKFSSAATPIVKKGEKSTFTAQNRSGSFMCGVSGGVTYDINFIDMDGMHHILRIGIGLSHPYLGGVKTSVYCMGMPEWAEGLFSAKYVARLAYDHLDDEKHANMKLQGDVANKTRDMHFKVVATCGSNGKSGWIKCTVAQHVFDEN